MSDLADIIEIKDPEIDVRAIMEKIKEGIEKRRAIYEEDVFFPTFNASDVSTAKHLSREFAYELQEALDCHDQVGVSSEFEDKSAPIIGPILTRFRRELHNLVIFYANILASKQVSFNAHAIRSVAKLADIVAGKANLAEQAQLRQELNELQAKVERLEKELATQRSSSATAEGADGR